MIALPADGCGSDYYQSPALPTKAHEPRPKGRGVYLGGVSTPPKLGSELPVPEGPGFGSLDQMIHLFQAELRRAGIPLPDV